MSKEFEYTDDYFLDREYKKYNKTPFQSDMILYNFQKRFDDDVGKKYFIDVHKATNEWMREWDKQQSWYTPYSYTYSCQLYRKDTHAAVDMEFFSSWTIDQVEEFVENLFQSGKLDYYEKWCEC